MCIKIKIRRIKIIHMYAMGYHTYVSSPATQIRNNPAKLKPCRKRKQRAPKSGQVWTHPNSSG